MCSAASLIAGLQPTWLPEVQLSVCSPELHVCACGCCICWPCLHGSRAQSHMGITFMLMLALATRCALPKV